MKIRLLALLLFTLPILADAEPVWIWSSKQAHEDENEQFRKTFTVQGEIKSATLVVTCDNGAKAFLNGKEALTNPDWMKPSRADVKNLLHAGQNELRLDAHNNDGIAALIVSLTIETADGKKMLVESSGDWQFAPPGGADWKPVEVIAKYGDAPWDDALNAVAEAPTKAKGKMPRATGAATKPEDIVTLPGFKVEHLYTVPNAEQGSWVSMTIDPKNRLIVCDQRGGLFRVTVPPIGSKAEPAVEPLHAEIGGAHGLLFAFNSLYVMVNETAGKQGLWRLKYRASDDQFDAPELLCKLDGGGEHGPHGVVLGPDGKSIYFVAGNHTKPPASPTVMRTANAWGEDHLLPRMWDANGHARGILAPGGYTIKTDPDGKKIELFCAGFRNHYDIAFDANGELFTYDSDMEWDMGAPWYMPTRINHCVSGGDYGWRSGAGRWPAYYADSLPAAVNIGPGSPTGTVFGTGAKFPAKYQRAFFASDWTYGTMYAIHLVPDGASFKAVKEEFVSGKPLPLTDLLINPADGAMYFLIGGRGSQSALYRVTYAGKEPTARVAALPVTPDAKLRRGLETLHTEGTGPDAVAKAWPYLGHKDRFVRFAARVAIERQPVAQWTERALAEKDPVASIEALIALARMGRSAEAAGILQPPKHNTSTGAVGGTPAADAALQNLILESLARIDYEKLSGFERLALLRAYALCFTRMGKPAPEICAQVAAKLDALYPQKESEANRELCQLLVFLDSKTAVAKTLKLMATAKDDHVDIGSDTLLARNTGYAKAAGDVARSRPNREQMMFLYSLRNATAGWTPESRKTYFSWFQHAHKWKGGNSFKGFVENIRKEALENFVPEPERAALDELSSKSETVAENIVPPKGPGRDYTVESALALAPSGLSGRNFEDGKNMFNALNCAVCHRFNGDGGGIGPDITGAGNRYNLHDLLENIIEPSKVVSDQYESHEIETKDGTLVTGRIVVEENGKLFVMTNPFAPNDLVAIESNEIKNKTVSKTSIMPPGLINLLNPDELLDLLAYLQSGGNPQDKVFKK